jgi:hypothetical protein
MEHPDSPRPRQRRRIALQQNEGAQPAAPEADNNHNTTIHNLNDDLLGLCRSFLGVGHYRYCDIACKMILQASQRFAVDDSSYRKITTGESVTSSVSCAKEYFEDVGTAGQEQLRFFWLNAVRYGRVDVMEWAHAWMQEQNINHMFGSICLKACTKAAMYGQLQALQWLREKGCDWDWHTCHAAACNGHLSCLQWARENGCSWNTLTCRAAAHSGHLSCLKWAIENGCAWDEYTCHSASINGHVSCIQWARENGCPGADEYDILR